MPTRPLVSPKNRTHRSTVWPTLAISNPEARSDSPQWTRAPLALSIAKVQGWRRALAPQPNVLLLSLPSSAQAGLEWLRELHASLPRLPILAIAKFANEDELLETLDAGASGCLRETASAFELIQAAHDLLQGGCVVEPKVAKRILQPLTARRRTDSLKSTILSCRELEVLRLVATGSPNARVGRDLGVSSATVRTHLERIYEKLHVANRVEAVARSIALGLFRTTP